MSDKFYTGQKDYIAKLNELDSIFTLAAASPEVISAANASAIDAKQGALIAAAAAWARSQNAALSEFRANASATSAQTSGSAVALTGNLAAGTGAGLVGFVQSGTGAFARTLQAKLSDTVNVRDFGGVGNGVANDTAAVNAAAAALTYGGTIYFPNGNYLLDAITLPIGVSLLGDSFFSTTLTKTAAAVSFLVLAGANAVRKFSLTSQGSPSSGSLVQLNGNKCEVSDCQLTNYFNGITAGSAETTVVFPLISNCNFFAPRVIGNGSAVFLRNFSNALVTGCVLSGTLSGTQPDAGIRIQNGDTCFLTDCNATRHGLALLVDTPAGEHLYALRIKGCLFDSSGGTSSLSTVSAALIAPAGSVVDTLIADTWFGLSTAGSGLEVTTTGTGAVDGLGLSNCQFVNNAISGVSFIGTNVRNFSVNGGYASANAVYGLRIGSGVSKFVINGFTAANVGTRGANARGINIDSGASDNYLVTNCRLQDNTVFDFFDGGSGLKKIVSNNLFT